MKKNVMNFMLGICLLLVCGLACAEDNGSGDSKEVNFQIVSSSAKYNNMFEWKDSRQNASSEYRKQIKNKIKYVGVLAFESKELNVKFPTIRTIDMDISAGRRYSDHYDCYDNENKIIIRFDKLISKEQLEINEKIKAYSLASRWAENEMELWNKRTILIFGVSEKDVKVMAGVILDYIEEAEKKAVAECEDILVEAEAGQEICAKEAEKLKQKVKQAELDFTSVNDAKMQRDEYNKILNEIKIKKLMWERTLQYYKDKYRQLEEKIAEMKDQPDNEKDMVKYSEMSVMAGKYKSLEIEKELEGVELLSRYDAYNLAKDEADNFISLEAAMVKLDKANDSVNKARKMYKDYIENPTKVRDNNILVYKVE